MDHLPHLVELLIDFGFRPFKTFLGQVDDIGEEIAPLLDSPGVGALFELDAFGLQEAAQVLIKFFFIDRFHNSVRRWPRTLQISRNLAITGVASDCKRGRLPHSRTLFRP